MLSSALAAATQPQRKGFKAPSGRFYAWTKDTPPTQADIDAIVAYDNAYGESDRAKGMGAGLAAERADAQAKAQARANELKKPYRYGDKLGAYALNVQRAPITPEQLRSVTSTLGGSPGEIELAAARLKGEQPSYTVMRDAVDQSQSQFADFLKPYMASVSPVAPGLAAGMISGIAHAGPNILAELGTLGAGNSSVGEKAGAAANIALNVLPLDAVFGKAIGITAAKAGRMLLNSKASPTIVKGIDAALKNGIEAETIIKGLGGTPEARAAVESRVLPETSASFRSGATPPIQAHQAEAMPPTQPVQGKVTMPEESLVPDKGTPEYDVHIKKARADLRNLVLAYARFMGAKSLQHVRTNILNNMYDHIAKKYGVSPEEISKGLNDAQYIHDSAPDLIDEMAKSGNQTLTEFMSESNPLSSMRRSNAQEGGAGVQSNQAHQAEAMPPVEAPPTQVPPTQTPPAESVVPPKAAVPPVDTPPVETPQGQGIAHDPVAQLRTEMGWKPSDKTPKSDAELAKQAEAHAGNEFQIASRVNLDPKATLTDSEAVAVGKRLTSLMDEMDKAKTAGNTAAYDAADMEAQHLADALDASGSRQGRAFRARQFVFQNQMDGWGFSRKVQKAAGGDLPPKMSKELQSHMDALDATNKDLQIQLAEAQKQIESLTRQRQAANARGPRNPQQQRDYALSRLRKLGVPTIDSPEVVAGGMGSKKRGAINIPVDREEDVAAAVRTLVRSYSDSANSYADVMSRLKTDLPGIDDQQAAWLLSGSYKKAKLEADVAKMQAMRFLGSVKADAESRMQPFLGRAARHALEVLNFGQRSLQTTLDNSMALIQARKLAYTNPVIYLKAVAKSTSAFARKDPIKWVEMETAKLQNRPSYPLMVQAKLALSDVHGSYSKQEEAFASFIDNKIPLFSHSKAAATTMMNSVRADVFDKMLAGLPKDMPDDQKALALRDFARTINIVSGKGDGRIAETLGSKELGALGYAPRYTWSKVQYNRLDPIWAAKTKAGRAAAAKMYGAQIAGTIGLIKLAEMNGAHVELDSRSTNFGTATLPNGTSVDLFRSDTEGVRTMVQLFYGKMSNSGDFKDPTQYGAFNPGDYLYSKMSAGLRTADMVRTGTTYDDKQNKWRTAEPADFWRSWVPLSIQEMWKNQDHPEMAPVSFFGGNVAEAKKPSPNVPLKPMSGLPEFTKYVPPGIQKMLKGN